MKYSSRSKAWCLSWWCCYVICDMLLTALHDYNSSIFSRLRYLETLVICKGTLCPRPSIPSYLLSLFLLGLDHLLHLALCVCILQSLEMWSAFLRSLLPYVPGCSLPLSQSRNFSIAPSSCFQFAPSWHRWSCLPCSWNAPSWFEQMIPPLHLERFLESVFLVVLFWSGALI